MFTISSSTHLYIHKFARFCVEIAEYYQYILLLDSFFTLYTVEMLESSSRQLGYLDASCS